MTSKDENVQALVDLGLTRAQAKVYLALLNLSTAPISEIAKASKVARPDTYRAILVLQEQGLVQKVISKPAKYTPLSLENAVEVLMSRREKENAETDNRVSKLISQFSRSHLNHTFRENNQFVLVSGGVAVTLEVERRAGKASRSIYALMPSRRLQQFMSTNSIIKDALDRKVSVRIVTEAPQTDELGELISLMQSPYFELYILPYMPSVWLAIIDDKETIFTTSAKLDYSKAEALSSNNPVLMEFVKGYFDCAISQAEQFKQSVNEPLSKDSGDVA